MSETLTTKQAADKLGVSPARVRQLVLSGQLPAEKFGRDIVIKASDLTLVKDRPMGRPPKSAPTTQKTATGQIRASNGASTKRKGGKK
jgi:excisionase family DNA binding protein